MKRTFLTWVAIAILLGSLTTFAQPDTLWTRTYSVVGIVDDLLSLDDEFMSLTYLDIFDSTSADWSVELWSTKFSANGDTMWSTNFFIPHQGSIIRSASVGIGNSVYVLLDGFRSHDENRFVIIKIDSSGQRSHVAILPFGTNWKEIRVGANGRIIICGEAWINAQRDIHLIILDSTNDVLTDRFFGDSSAHEFCNDMLISPNGDILVIGNKDSGDVVSTGTAWIARFDSAAGFLWSREYDYSLNDEFFSNGCNAPEGGFLLIGNQGRFNLGPGWFVRIEDSGDSIWTKKYYAENGHLDSVPIDVLATPSGFLCVGVYNTFNPWAIHLATNGSISWQVCCWGNDRQTYYVARLGNGSTYLAGRTYSSENIPYPYLVCMTDDSTSGTQAHSAARLLVALHPNYPNPFNPSTEISFDLPHSMQASLKVYDVLGREVAELVDGVMTAGAHTIQFDGTAFASGIYFYRLQAEAFVETKKMILLK